ncbi:MAG: type II toxin-antitoxin system Phd/YefM family antitoxin [Sphingomonadales bacterium]|nr:MAG: type II toxin-antitoxin system Phd/YefM family antitoxin [Sphingomonadales bacterium]
MKMVTSREFNQDVSLAKRLARDEPVIVTDRGRPTHVLLSIDAYQRLSGQADNLADLLAAAGGSEALDPADLQGAWGRR